AEIEDAHQERGREWNPRHNRPIHHFFHLQHRKAKSLAASTKNAELPLRQPLFKSGFALEEFATLEINRPGRVFLLVCHQASLFTSSSNSSGVNGFTTYPFAPCCSPQ